MIPRLKLQLGDIHETFPSLEKLGIAESIDSALTAICESRQEAKQIAISVFNGGRIPDELAGNSFLLSLRREGCLLRWVAIGLLPGLHNTFVADQKWRNAEATTWFYLWSSVENYILCSWAGELLTKPGLKHISLHFDALLLDSEPKLEALEFIRESENHIFTKTGYNVKLVNKRRQSLFLG